MSATYTHVPLVTRTLRLANWMLAQTEPTGTATDADIRQAGLDLAEMTESLHRAARPNQMSLTATEIRMAIY